MNELVTDIICSPDEEVPVNLLQFKCKKLFKRKKIQMLNNGIYTVWKLVSCGRTMSMGNDLLSEKRGLAFSTIFLVFKCKMLLQFCFI